MEPGKSVHVVFYEPDSPSVYDRKFFKMFARQI